MVRTMLVAGLLLATAVAAEDAKVVWVVNHGWHVGIAVARADVSPAVWPESAEVGRRYIEVGWGDGEYYPAPETTVGMGLKAAFGSGSSVLHMAAFDPAPAEFFAGSPVVRVTLSARGFEALTRFIASHYARDASGRAVVAAPGRYGEARFYRATGRYRLLDNSNTWAAKALHAAGCPIDEGTLTAGGVVRQIGELRPGSCR